MPQARGAADAQGNVATAPLIRIAASLAVFFLGLFTLFGCADLTPHDTSSLFFPGLQRSEIVGTVAGLGTTFAAAPDLVAMLRRRSSVGVNPTMAGIMGAFQIVWVYYGLLIASRPVIAWNLIAVVINFLSVSVHAYFCRKEKATSFPRGVAGD